MSREVDERIVALHFENEQFEKGAKDSIKTIEELKKKLDFEGVGESFEQISKATEKGFGLKNTTRETNLLSRSLKSLGNIAAYPFQAMSRSLMDFNGYLRTYLGFDLAGKLVNTGREIMRTFTIDPMKTGWNEYELKMDSIKTIMTGTADEYKKILGSEYTEAAHLEIVNKKIEQLNKYADDTIYSFQDMTSNIGKFTNNGVKLDQATAAIMGISNATAQAGQGANEASRAMYNLSQAIGMGKLTTIDYKSIEQANIATSELKNAFIQVGKSLGTLKKEGDKYFTTTGKKLEVTAENFRETLSSGWVNKDVLVATLAAYSGEYSFADLMQDFGITDENVAKQLADIGQAAKKSATEVRTFSKMWAALKESAQSGWAVSWEMIFGNMTEGSNFWTQINEKLSKILNDAAEKRNDLLRGWRGQITNADQEAMTESMKRLFDSEYYKNQYGVEAWYKNENGIASIVSDIADHFDKYGTTPEKVDELIKTLGTKYKLKETDARRIVSELAEDYNKLDYVGKDGREDLTAGVNNIIDAFVNLKDTISSVKKAIYGETTSSGLQSITEKFAQVTEKIKNFTASLKEGDTFEIIKKIFEGLSSALNAVWGSIKKLGGIIGNVLGPIGTFLLDIFAKIGEWFNSVAGKTISETISNIISKIKSLNKVKIVEWLKKVKASVTNLFKTIKTNVVNWANSNGFGGFVEKFTKIWESVKNAWEGFKKSIQESEALKAIGTFFTDIWTAIINIFSENNKVEDNGEKATAAEKEADDSENTFTRIINKVKTGFDNAIKACIDVINAIGTFFTNIFTSIVNIFHEESGDSVENENIVTNAEEEAGESQSIFVRIFEKVKIGFENAKNACIGIIQAVGTFLSNVFNAIIGIFHNESNDSIEGKDATTNAEEEAGNSQSTFENIFKKVETGFTNAKNAFTTIINAVGEFLTNVFNAIVGMFRKDGDSKKESDVTVQAENEAGKSQSVFESIFEKLKNGFENAKNTFMDVIRAIGAFLTNVFNSVVKIFHGDGGKLEKDENALAEAESQADNSQSIFGDIFNKIKEGFDAAVTEASSIISSVGKFLTNVFSALLEIFRVDNASAEEIPAEEQAQNSGSVFSRIWAKITAAWATFVEELKGTKVFQAIGTFFTNIYNYIYNLFVSNGKEEAGEELPEPVTQADATDKFNSYVSGIKTAFEEVIKALTPLAQRIYQFFADIWAFLMDLISGPSKESKSEQPLESEMSFLDVFGPGDESNVVEKVGILERIFNVISKFVSDVQGWDGWEVIGQFLKDVGGMFRDIVGTLAESIIGEQASETVVNFFESIMSILHWVSETLRLLVDPNYGTQEAKENAQSILKIVGVFALVIEAINKIPSRGFFSLGLGSEFMGLGLGILGIAAAITLLGKLNTAQLWQGGIAVAAIAAILYFLLPSISTLVGSIAKLNKLVNKKSATERVIEAIFGHGALIIGLKSILTALPTLLDSFAKAKQKSPDLNGKDIFYMCLGIASVVMGLSLAVGALGLISKLNIDAGAFASVAVGIDEVMLAVFGGVIAIAMLIDDMWVRGRDEAGNVNLDELRTYLGTVTVFFETIGDILGSFFGSISGMAIGKYNSKKTGEEAKGAVEAGKTLFEAFGDFDMEQLDKLDKISSVVGGLTEKIANPNIWKDLIGGGVKFSEMPQVFADVGQALNSFVIMCHQTYKAVGGSSGLAEADLVMQYLESVARISMMASLMGSKFNGYSTADLLTQFLMAFTDFNWDAGELQESINAMASLAEMINSSFAEAAPNIDVSPLIQAIARGIRSKESTDMILEAFQGLGAWVYDEYGIDTSYIMEKIEEGSGKIEETVNAGAEKVAEITNSEAAEAAKSASEKYFGNAGILGNIISFFMDPSHSIIPTASADSAGIGDYITGFANMLGLDLSNIDLSNIDFSNPEAISGIVKQLGGNLLELLNLPNISEVVDNLSEAFADSEEAAAFFKQAGILLSTINKYAEMTPDEFKDFASSYISAIFTALDESYKEMIGDQTLVEYLFGSDIASSVESFGPFTEENLKAKTKGMISSLLTGMKEAISEDADLSVVANYIQSAMTLNAEDAKAKAKEYVKAALEGIDEALSESKTGNIILTVAPVLASNEKFIDSLLNGGKLDTSGVINIASESLSPVMANIISSADSIVSNNTAQTSRIVTAVNNLGGRIAGVESAIMGINIVLDTGAIAGVVDDRLGRKKQAQDRQKFVKR